LTKNEIYLNLYLDAFVREPAQFAGTANMVPLSEHLQIQKAKFSGGTVLK